MPQKYVIGIDLGTTNSALAFAELPLDPRELAPVTLLGIPQLVNPGEVRDEELLPSFLYIAGPSDFPAGSTELPWPSDPALVTGELAKKRGGENERRLVVSAKSWLSHAGVDRTAAILPPREIEEFAEALARDLSEKSRESLRLLKQHLTREWRNAIA